MERLGNRLDTGTGLTMGLRLEYYRIISRFYGDYLTGLRSLTIGVGPWLSIVSRAAVDTAPQRE